MKGWSPGMVSDYISNSSGVYLWNPIKEGAQYVGSTIDLYERTLAHMRCHRLKKLTGMYEWAMANGGLSVWDWGTVYQTPNFALNFIKAHPHYVLSPIEFVLLHHVTQYLPRVLEHSLLHTFKFGWNKSLTVQFPRVRTKDCTPVDVIGSSSGTVLSSYPSLKTAGYAVGIKCRSTTLDHIKKKTIIKDTAYGEDILIKKGKRMYFPVSSPLVYVTTRTYKYRYRPLV